jgi:penicillin-binding protein 2
MVETLSPFTSESDRRVRVLVFLGVVGFSLLGFRLFQLQVVRGAAMARLAELNRTQIIPLQAPRGFIWDRNHDILVDNAPSFSLLFTAQSVPVDTQRELEDTLVQHFPKQEAVIHKKMAEARRTGKMTRILRGIPHDVALSLIERKMTLPGVNVLAEPQRRARHGTLAAHLLGYVDEVGPARLKTHGDMYKPGDLVGKSGLESMYDADIRGVDGGLQFETDASGHHVRTVQRIPSRSGTDLVLTIDRHRPQGAGSHGSGHGKSGLPRRGRGAGPAHRRRPRLGQPAGIRAHGGLGALPPGPGQALLQPRPAGGISGGIHL